MPLSQSFQAKINKSLKSQSQIWKPNLAKSGTYHCIPLQLVRANHQEVQSSSPSTLIDTIPENAPFTEKGLGILHCSGDDGRVSEEINSPYLLYLDNKIEDMWIVRSFL